MPARERKCRPAVIGGLGRKCPRRLLCPPRFDGKPWRRRRAPVFAREDRGAAPAPPAPLAGGFCSGRCQWGCHSGSISLYLRDSPPGGCPFCPPGELPRPGEVDCAGWGSRAGMSPGLPGAAAQDARHHGRGLRATQDGRRWPPVAF